MAALTILIEILGQSNHGRRNIHTPALRKMTGERSGETSHTTTKIKGWSSFVQSYPKQSKMFQNFLNLALAGLKKLFDVPLLVAFFRVSTDGPQRIGLSE